MTNFRFRGGSLASTLVLYLESIMPFDAATSELLLTVSMSLLTLSAGGLGLLSLLTGNTVPARTRLGRQVRYYEAA